MKKTYITPALKVTKVETKTQLLADSYTISNSSINSDAWAKENDYDMGDDW